MNFGQNLYQWFLSNAQSKIIRYSRGYLHFIKPYFRRVTCNLLFGNICIGFT